MIKEKYSDLVPEMNSWLLPRENGFLLSDKQIEVLFDNGINYLDYSNMKSMLIKINDILNEKYDDDLNLVALSLSENDYYSSIH